MASVELSAGIMSGISARMIRYGENMQLGSVIVNRSGLLGNKPWTYTQHFPVGQIAIMKGSVPAVASLADYTSRSADILVLFSCDNVNPSVANDFSLVNQSANPATIATTYRAAVANGTATWFWWFQRDAFATSWNNTLYHQIVGTVGAIGSGADLEIPNVNIVAGVQYRLRNMKLQFPSQWTY